MFTVEEEEFSARFVVVKNSWKGHYTRGFAVSSHRVVTLKPRSLREVTNSWTFGQTFIDVVPEPKSRTQFTLVYNKSGKIETMSFDSPNEEDRGDLLTSVQRYRAVFDRQYTSFVSHNTFSGFKNDFHGSWIPIELRVTNFAIEQFSSDSPRRKLGEYLFTHIKGMTSLEGEPDTVIIVYGPLMKLHLYRLSNTATSVPHNMNGVNQFMQKVKEHSFKYIGLSPLRAMNTLTQTQFRNDRLGIRQDALEAIAEFPVLKLSVRHANAPESRLLSSTASAIVERDPLTYEVVCVYPLRSVFCLVRYGDDEQRLDVVFKEPPVIKGYSAPLRDALLAHLLDACRDAGNLAVHILPYAAERGRRWSEWRRVVSEEVESALLSLVAQSEWKKEELSSPLSFESVVRYFNANVEYSGLRWSENKDGLFAENRERLIYSALQSLLTRLQQVLQYVINARHKEKINVNSNNINNINNNSSSSSNVLSNNTPDSATAPINSRLPDEAPLLVQVSEYFHALRRLTVSRIGFSSTAVIPPLMRATKLCAMQALTLDHVIITESVTDFLNTLMAPHHNFYEVEHESINKNALLLVRLFSQQQRKQQQQLEQEQEQENNEQDGLVDTLLLILQSCIHRDSAALVIQQILQFLVYALCPPFSESTESGTFRQILRKMVKLVGKSLFHLLRHPCLAIRYAAGQLIRVVLEEGTQEQFTFMQRASLTEGGFLMQFNVAVFGTHRPIRDLARRLLAYWAYQNVEVQDLLRRMIPLTLLNFLQSSEQAPLDEQEQILTKGVLAMTEEFRESKVG